MRIILSFLVLITFSNLAPAFGQAADLFFSEYVEGSSNNKALEIYNGTGAAATLSEYVVELYSNGSSSAGNTLTLSAIAPTLADGDVVVIANASADPSILAVADITSSVTFFNGDDAIALRRNGVLIDVIGVIGSDPGTEWGSGGTTTKEHTIRRRDTVCQGDADGFDNPTDITAEWEGFAQNTFGGLGAHTAFCGGVNLPVVANCNSPFDVSAGVGGTHGVSADDADGVIASIAITDITPVPAAGSITLGSFTAGSPATAIVTVTAVVPVGSYTVEITATNTDVTPQSGICNLTVNVLPPPTAGWVINEFLADPASGLAGDANGDGVRDFSDDEFVEIVNVTGSNQDISGFTIADAVTTRHTFPAGTVLANNKAVVVFGGGTPTGTFGDSVIQTASSGALGFNNGGDTITFASDLGVVQAQVSYGSEGGNNQSLTLDPDLTGAAYVDHSGATGSGGALFSPGTRTDGTAFGIFADDLFFSEYIEGSSNNKALEIYNGTGSSANLSEYVVELYNNGASSPNQTLNLSAAAATLADSDVLVIANASATGAILAVADITSAVTFFNGDDALALRRNGTLIDVIGVIGSDPGTRWGSGTTTTRDDTIRRLPSICAGDPDGFDNPSDITNEWEGFPQNTFDGLGSHVANCAANAPVVVDCDSPLAVPEGSLATHLVTAEDEDGTIVSITISNITPAPAAGSITIGSFTPAGGGNPASALVTVSAAVPAGAYVVEITAANDDTTPQTGVCELTINVLEVKTIHEIQGPGLISPLVGQVIITQGNIVTAVDTNGFFIQTPDADVDADLNTSEGIFVFTGGAPSVATGDEIDVAGTVVEFFGFTQISNNPAVDVITSANALPATVTLDTSLPAPNLPPQENQLEPLEGMLVRVVNGFTPGPSNQFGDVPFQAGGLRPFREPGIEFPGIAGLPVWDGNPEVFELDPDALGLPDAEYFTGTPIDLAEGPLGFAFGDYQLQPTTLVAQPSPNTLQSVRATQAGEFTVATQNMFRLFRDQPSTSGYADRLSKFSLLIRNVLGAPDILALQEVESIGVLQDLADKIALDDGAVQYTPHLIEGNDVGGIDVGFLTRDTIQVDSLTQIQPTLQFVFAGQSSPLHDRPPLLLEGSHVGGAAPFPISVIAIHNRSLNGIEDADGRVRQKRFEQADNIAQAIQALQTADPDARLVVLGDFNGFEFTDGYVDVLGQQTGNLDPLGALLPGIDHINPDLVNQTFSVPPAERYSFVFNGNAQAIDHILTSAGANPFVVEIQHGRANADAPRGSLESDASTPLRASDHDGVVLYLLRDQDQDGVIDDEDECLNSDVTATVVIDGCDSGVPNVVLSSGCTISDLIAACAANATNHGNFVSCVSHLTNDLKKAGIITGQQKGAITSCAGQADIP